MEIEFDETKRLDVLAERGLDFQDAATIFEGFYLNRRDDRHEYNEDRFIALGEIDDTVVIVVWTLREDRRRIITMWKASHGERETYYRRRDASG